MRWGIFDEQLHLKLGRMPNPFVVGDLVWDADLGFEGATSSWTMYSLKSSGAGVIASFMAGAFPIQEVELSQQDKWLYSMEASLNWQQANQNKLRAAIGYFAFDNIAGEKIAWIVNSPTTRHLKHAARKYSV